MKPTKYAAFLSAFLLAAAVPCVTNSAAVRPTIAFAEEETKIVDSNTLCETIAWELDSAGTLTITGSGDMSEITNTFKSHKNDIKKVIIRNTDAENTITAIASSLFSGYTAIKEVTLPDTIKTIGDSAFSGCTSLSVCNFPSSLKTIGKETFKKTGLSELTLPGCELGFQSFSYMAALKSLTIKEGTETIPQECFRECTALENVYLPDSVKTISGGRWDSEGAFHNCTSLKKVSIGKDIESIHYYAFRTLGEELEVEFRKGVTAVPESAFDGRTELTKVILPESLKSVGDYSFRNCSNLSECDFPSTLETIGSEAFKNTGLTELKLPGCELGTQAFAYSAALKSVTIGEGTETLPKQCFRNCDSLESVYLPDSVKTISGGRWDDEGSFHNCPSLKKVSIGKDIESIHNFAFRTLGEELEVEFRKGVTAVPESAFDGRTELTKVILPESLKSVGDYSFRNCSNLSECDFPSTLETIGSEAFKNTGLTELKLPGCELGTQAFAYSAALKSVTIGEGTETLPKQCFRNCDSLESVYLPDSVKTISGGRWDDEGSFHNCPSLKKVSIGKDIESIHNFAFRTLGEELEVEFRDGVTAVPENAFDGRNELTKVILPDSLKSVGDYSFRNCSNLSECNFPSALETIGSESFRNTGLTELTLPGCEFGTQAFAYSAALKSVTISEGTDTIPKQCFRNCDSLESAYLPDSVKTISGGRWDDDGSFHNCPSLKKVSIGKNIESIHYYAFRTLGKELEVIFREGVTVVPESAFDGRTELTKVVLPESLKSIGTNAFKGCSSLGLICIQAPDCDIPFSENVIPSDAVIRGYENSTAQEYAREFGRVFETFSEDDPVIAYGNQITGISLTLDGKIGINFFGTLNSKAAKVVLSGPNGNVVYSGDELTAAKQNNGVYCFTYRVYATQAADKIELRVYDANNRQLDIYKSNFEKYSNKLVEYTVNDYIANVPQYNNDENLKAMVTALDNYCKAAENYFLKTKHALNIPEASVVKTNDFQKKFEISLVLNSGTALRIYSDAENAVRVNGEKEIPLTSKTVKNNDKYFEIPEIAAFNLLDNITVKLDGTTYKVCPTDYCALILAKSDDKKLRDVCNALYYYGVAAKAYGTGIQN